MIVSSQVGHLPAWSRAPPVGAPVLGARCSCKPLGGTHQLLKLRDSFCKKTCCQSVIVSSQVGGHLPAWSSPTCGCACRPLGAPRCSGKDENIAGAIPALLHPAPFAFLFWQETLILRIASPLNKRKDLMFIHRSHLPVNAFELHLCNFGKWWQLLLNYLLNHWSTTSNQTLKISRRVHIKSNPSSGEQAR